MGFATPYEAWVAPMARDWPMVVPMVLLYFAAQIAAQHLVLPRIPNWRKFSTADKEDLVIRAVSIVNGGIMVGSAVIFLTNLFWYHGMRLPADLYVEVQVPFFPFFRAAIVAYFIWDVITCFAYKWSVAWKVHGVASMVGAYILAFPFSDVYAGFYTGCFELSNAFLHLSTINRTIARYNRADKKRCARLESQAVTCDYIFAALYTLIRVVAGSYVTFTWVSVAWANLSHDFLMSKDGSVQPRCHDVAAYCVALFAIGTVQLLQYVWFKEIVKAALGIGAPAADDGAAAKVDAPPAAKKG